MSNSLADKVKTIVEYTFVLDVYEVKLMIQANSRSEYDILMKRQKIRIFLVYIVFFITEGIIFVKDILKYPGLISNQEFL